MVGFENWSDSEPNNLNDEDCVEASRWKNYQWNDTGCTIYKQFVCEA